jgi:hypothetical protein
MVLEGKISWEVHTWANYKKWSWKEKSVGKFTLGPMAQATLVCKTIKYTHLHCLPRVF